MIELNILIGNENARLNTNKSIIIRALFNSNAVIVSPNIVSTLKYSIAPTANEITPIMTYRMKNIPNISYCSVSFPSALYFAVYLTTAFPNPKSRIVRYAITDATSEYSPYSLCPIMRSMYGVYSNPTSVFSRITI